MHRMPFAKPDDVTRAPSTGLLVGNLPESVTSKPRWANVLVVHYDRRGRVKGTHRAKNLITDAGAIWYGQKITGETPTNAFIKGAVGTGNGGAWGASSTYTNLTGPIAGSVKDVDSGYPKRNDNDTANTGAGTKVVSWRWSYASSDFTSGTPVTDGVITVASPTTGTPILTGYTLGSSFTLATGESIKIFVNHTLTPV